MNKKVRPVIALMKVRGATKEEIDQMNLYFDKYNLDDVYKAIQRITSEKRREKELINEAEEAMASLHNSLEEEIMKKKGEER